MKIEIDDEHSACEAQATKAPDRDRDVVEDAEARAVARVRVVKTTAQVRHDISVSRKQARSPPES